MIVAFFFLRDGEEERSVAKAQKGDITREVFETGEAKKGDEISLGFTLEGGELETLHVDEGDDVEKDDSIASLDEEELEISLREARSALSSAQAGLERLLKGATQEEIDSAEASVESAESALETAKENLENTERTVQESLNEVHRNTPHLLSDVHHQVEEMKDDVDKIAKEHFTGIYLPETYSARRSRDSIKDSEEIIADYREMVVEKEVDFEEKDEAIEVVREEMKEIIRELDNIIDVAESDFYEDRMKETLTLTPVTSGPEHDTQALKMMRREMNSHLDDVSSLKQNVDSVRAETDAKLSAARGEKNSAEKALREAQKSLANVRAQAPAEEVRQKEAAVEQAQAQVELLEKKLRDSTLTAPMDGMISNTLKKEGEIVGGGEPVVTMIPDDDFYVEVLVYEGDVAEVNVGDDAEISFVAFDDQYFEGEVASVGETAVMDEGVIYYETIVSLDESPEYLKPDMTADVTIFTEEKEDVLMIPDEAVRREDGETFVRILADGEEERREVELGILGEGRMREVVSGVEEGESVIIE